MRPLGVGEQDAILRHVALWGDRFAPWAQLCLKRRSCQASGRKSDCAAASRLGDREFQLLRCSEVSRLSFQAWRYGI